MSRRFTDNSLFGESRWVIGPSKPPESRRMIQAADISGLESRNAVTALLEQGFTANHLSQFQGGDI